MMCALVIVETVKWTMMKPALPVQQTQVAARDRSVVRMVLVPLNVKSFHRAMTMVSVNRAKTANVVTVTASAIAVPVDSFVRTECARVVSVAMEY
jgi:hypothetical protein